ncbi:hypothetical protein BABINDRAFT_10221 [Babjeviella inositovora NRRL Y-12698]|uniref:Uncharacterized protein n=1 Tax=Babjeviella inositovora NRRL Y-12698 TaxID=984486 RepID=A0A1E3QI01_9ASCO|nr:uncharacterized protein BABINDRAFT_10221 [Babjeviella inositovora NRRL Y-12698]ODQ77319.1 hypothetical protein BABINDRAFT_10221 [Babjeviella inositovora NRRL Y-12698]
MSVDNVSEPYFATPEDPLTTDYEVLFTTIDDVLRSYFTATRPACDATDYGDWFSYLLQILQKYNDTLKHNSLWVLLLVRLLQDTLPPSAQTACPIPLNSVSTEPAECVYVRRVFELVFHYISTADAELIYYAPPQTPHQAKTEPESTAHLINPFFNQFIALFYQVSKAYQVELGAVRLQELTNKYYAFVTEQLQTKRGSRSYMMTVTPLLTYLVKLANNFQEFEMLKEFTEIQAKIISGTLANPSRPKAAKAFVNGVCGLMPSHLVDYYYTSGLMYLQSYIVNRDASALKAAGECFQVLVNIPPFKEEGPGANDSDTTVRVRLYYILTKLLSVSSLRDIQVLVDRDTKFQAILKSKLFSLWKELRYDSITAKESNYGQDDRFFTLSGTLLRVLEKHSSAADPLQMEVDAEGGETVEASRRDFDLRKGPPVQEAPSIRDTLLGLYYKIFMSFLRMDVSKLAIRCHEYASGYDLLREAFRDSTVNRGGCYGEEAVGSNRVNAVDFLVVPLPLIQKLFFCLRLEVLKAKLAKLVTPVHNIEFLDDRITKPMCFSLFLQQVSGLQQRSGKAVKVEFRQDGVVSVDLVRHEHQGNALAELEAQQALLLTRNMAFTRLNQKSGDKSL